MDSHLCCWPSSMHRESSHYLKRLSGQKISHRSVSTFLRDKTMCSTAQDVGIRPLGRKRYLPPPPFLLLCTRALLAFNRNSSFDLRTRDNVTESCNIKLLFKKAWQVMAARGVRLGVSQAWVNYTLVSYE